VPYTLGDSDFDNDCDISDVLAVIDFILEEDVPTEDQFRNCDVNLDGEINIFDAIVMIDIIFGRASRMFDFDPDAVAYIDLVPAHSASKLLLNIEYTEILSGLQFDLVYDPSVLSLRFPNLSVTQEQVILSFNEKTPGTLKVVVINQQGGGIEPAGNTFISVPFEYNSEPDGAGIVTIEQVILAGPGGGPIDYVLRSAAQELVVVPDSYSLRQNYPNPFNPVTTIRFDLAEPSSTDLTLYNILGEKVQTVVEQYLNAGSYTFDVYAGNLPSGMYFYRLRAKDKDGFILYNASRKLLLIK